MLPGIKYLVTMLCTCALPRFESRKKKKDERWVTWRIGSHTKAINVKRHPCSSLCKKSSTQRVELLQDGRLRRIRKFTLSTSLKAIEMLPPQSLLSFIQPKHHLSDISFSWFKLLKKKGGTGPLTVHAHFIPMLLKTNTTPRDPGTQNSDSRGYINARLRGRRSHYWSSLAETLT